MSKTIVVKVGSSTLTNGTLHLSKPNMLELVRQIAMLHNEGHRILLVSSGAVAAGRDHLGHPQLSHSLPIKQMLAAVGQGQLMQLYSQMFNMYSVYVGQVLVTGDSLQRHRARYLNTRDTLEMLLDNRIVPIINENDTVAVDEIKVGDNDNLSALVASLVNADLLLLLTDRDGIYDKDPRQYPDARHIPQISRIDEAIQAIAKRASSSGLGIGGMRTKLQAAETAGRSGIETVIAHGSAHDVILRVVAGEAGLGTRILPTAPRVESRKRWLLSEPPAGLLIVDDGAAKVLLTGEASLLPVGLKRVEGEFRRGALVEVQDQKGHDLARGQVSYDSGELSQICGVKSGEIESILGYTYGDAAIHRDNLALLQLEG
jgi:glutamate 5-kinase